MLDETKLFIGLVVIITTISTLLLCTLTDDSFQVRRNADIMINVREK